MRRELGPDEIMKKGDIAIRDDEEIDIAEAWAEEPAGKLINLNYRVYCDGEFSSEDFEERVMQIIKEVGVSKLRELSIGIELFLVNDWAFRPDSAGYECAKCLHDVYMKLIMRPTNDASQEAIYLVMKGVLEGLSYDEIRNG